MKNHWDDEAARAMVASYAETGAGEDLALRVYTSRLIGCEPELVIHGGGNTSVKTTGKDFLGKEHDVLCVKGSGWDLSTIEPEGLPALYLGPLIEIRGRAQLSDEDMVRFLRANLLNPMSPNPSVETLLHAFLPKKFIDHSHATAILALVDQPDGMALCRAVYGDRVAIVPFVMPGFQLAKETADALEANPDVEGVILHKHGLFTFGDSARQSYDRMIDLVTAAEDHIARAPEKTPPPAIFSKPAAAPGAVAPIIRGACAIAHGGGVFSRLIADFRTSDQIRCFVDGRDLEASSRQIISSGQRISRLLRRRQLTARLMSLRRIRARALKNTKSNMRLISLVITIDLTGRK